MAGLLNHCLPVENSLAPLRKQHLYAYSVDSIRFIVCRPTGGLLLLCLGVVENPVDNFSRFLQLGALKSRPCAA